MATESAPARRSVGAALIDEVFDLVGWLGIEPSEAAQVVRSAFGELTAESHMRIRTPAEIETEVLVAAAARARGSRPAFWFRSPPRLDPGVLHPAAAKPAPVADVARLERIARSSLALVPPDDAAFVLLSTRYELSPVELSPALGISRRRTAEVLRRAHRGFVGCASAVLLWDEGEPDCDDLVELLDLTSIFEMRPSTAALVVHHGMRCADCRSRLWQVSEVVSAIACAEVARASTMLVAELGPLVRRLVETRPRGPAEDPATTRRFS